MASTVYPVASGHPDLSGTYIPTLYAMKLLVEFYKATVFGEIANTDYEGEIKQHGDKVTVRMLPSITVRDYVKGQGLNYESPEPATVELLIDQGKYWAISINKVDEVQADIDFVDKWAVHASEQVKIEIDSDILGDIYDDNHASNGGATAGLESSSINLGASGSPLSVTKSNVLDVLVDCGTVLDEQNVPETGRWCVIPPWMAGSIKKSDLKDCSMTGDGESVLRNGRLGRIDRFTLYSSNNLHTATDGTDSVTDCIFGHPTALTFASQMTEKEVIPNPDDFGRLLRALQVYGFKVVKSEALGRLYATKG